MTPIVKVINSQKGVKGREGVGGNAIPLTMGKVLLLQIIPLVFYGEEVRRIQYSVWLFPQIIMNSLEPGFWTRR
ncbi:hypothetical protein Glove_186g173 [Diversispora epigaea]|uniref:Uncharacterized protein n=1 Tax=Diversispora epigaea TaxID=1348612 RepID=A0A397IVD0_9GLOM|nr:hypothetical protein Glove_186g173 [Diversispora epigaea]